jgi:hypothetical protein
MMGSIHLDYLTSVRLSFAPLTVWSLLAALVRDKLVFKPSPERLSFYYVLEIVVIFTGEKNEVNT